MLNQDDPVIGLAIRKTRHTHGLIKQAGEFTLNLPAMDQLAIIDYCGTNLFSGKKVDKANELKLDLEKSQAISTPRIKDSPINLECRLKMVLTLSTKPRAHDFFIADVVACHRIKGFLIENHFGIVTTNYSYRMLGDTIGMAYQVHKKVLKE